MHQASARPVAPAAGLVEPHRSDHPHAPGANGRSPRPARRRSRRDDNRSAGMIGSEARHRIESSEPPHLPYRACWDRRQGLDSTVWDVVDVNPIWAGTQSPSAGRGVTRARIAAIEHARPKRANKVRRGFGAPQHALDLRRGDGACLGRGLRRTGLRRRCDAAQHCIGSEQAGKDDSACSGQGPHEASELERVNAWWSAISSPPFGRFASRREASRGRALMVGGC